MAKADLQSAMVGEFPELQGVMGALLRPGGGAARGGGRGLRGRITRRSGRRTPCRATPVSVAVALADKIDTLTGFWAIDEKPTGVKDPFALRRAALGVIRLVLENGVRLRLDRSVDCRSCAIEIGAMRRAACGA